MNYFKFFSIVTIAVILGLTSCKEGDTDTRELTGTWKTMNKDDYNIEAEGTLSSSMKTSLVHSSIATIRLPNSSTSR